MTLRGRSVRMGLLAALAFSGPTAAQVEPVQVIVPAEVAVESTSDKAVRAALTSAEEEGARNAWRVIKMRPDLALKVRNFTPDQNAALVSQLRSQCQVLLLDHSVDKKLKRVTGRFRYDCNQQELIVAIDQQLRQAPRAEGAAERPRIASFFLVKELDSATSYDPEIDRSASLRVQAGTSQSRSVTSQYQSDDRLRAKGTASVRERSSESWSENGGGLNEGVVTDTQATGLARLETRGKSTESSTTNAGTVVNLGASQKQQGRTITRAAVARYRNASPEELNTILTDVLKNAGVRIVQYADIQESCPGPSPDLIVREFGQQGEDLSAATRSGIIKAARACGFKFLVIGDALLDGTQADPVSGSPKTSVVMRAKVWRIDEQLPEVVGSIQKEVSAANSNASVAQANAVFQGAQRTGEEILARLSAEGFR